MLTPNLFRRLMTKALRQQPTNSIRANNPALGVEGLEDSSPDSRRSTQTWRVHQLPLSLERLEDRLAPATLTLTNGVLNYLAGAGINNALAVSQNPNKITFMDSAEVITTAISGSTGSGTNTVTVPAGGVVGIAISLLDGNDTLTVGSSAQAVTAPISYDGGLGTDTLTLMGGTATADTYSPGPAPGSGTNTLVIGGVTEAVTFQNLEPVVDLVAGPLVVNGTNADNAINYTQGSTAARGLVSVDNQEAIEFGNKTTLTINGLAGNDTINLNNPNTPTGLTGIAVNGGDPTGGAGDTLIVNGTTAADTVTIAPTAADAATVTGLGPTVTATTVEHLTYNGQGGNDTLIYNTPSNGNAGCNLVYTPGGNPDAGTITAIQVGGAALMPLTFSNLGGAGAVSFTTSNAGGRTDRLNVQGSPNAVGETFTVTPASGGAVQVSRQNGSNNLVTLPISTASVNNLELDGLGGNDVFNLTGTPGGLPFTNGIVVNDGATVNLNRAVGPVTVNLGDNTPNSPNPNTVITGYGAPVTLIGVDTANLDAGGNTLTATPTRQNDNTIYTPTGATAGTFYDDVGSGNNLVPNTVFNIANVAGNFMVFNDPGGNADQVTIRATAARDLIEISQGPGIAQVLANNVTPLLPVQLGISAEILNAVGLGGENTFQVIPAPGIAGQAQDNLLINIDGGTTGANNALVLGGSFGATPATLGANVFVVVNKSPEVNSGTVRAFTSAIANPDINYTNVQVVTANVSGGSGNPNLLVMGPDLNEPNEQLGTATFLGSAPTIQIQHAAIFTKSGELPGVPADNDFYRVVALTTGIVDFQVFFRTFSPALLPAGGNLSLAVLDAAGNVIGTPSAGSTRIRIPAVAGQSYYLHVVGGDAAVVNGYDATIINTDGLLLDDTLPNVTIRVDPTDSTRVQVLDTATATVLLTYVNGPANTIRVIGDGSNNTVTVDSSNGLVNAPISFDGGGGSNTLVLTQTGGATQTSDVYSPGPPPGQGTSVITGPSGTQTVSFRNLSPVLDNVPAATATVNGTAADNAVNYTQGPGGGVFTGTTGLVTVDDQESYEFNNKDNLVINGLAGSDTINLNNPTRPPGSTPGGLKNITVDVGDPTASDTLIVNGIAGGGAATRDQLVVSPTGTGAGHIAESTSAGGTAQADFVPVTFSNLEHLTLVGQNAELDRVASEGTGGNDTFEISPGATPDSGTITGFSNGAGGFTFVPITYQGFLGLVVTPFDGGGADTVIVDGTGGNDSFSFASASPPGSVGGPFQTVQLTTSGQSHTPIIYADFFVSQVILRGLGGNDTFNVNLNPTTGNRGVAVRVEAGAGTSTLNYTAPGGAATTIDLGASTITTTGANPVTFSGVATVNVNAGGAAVTVNGTAADDGLTYTPTGAAAGTVTLAGLNTVFNLTNVSTAAGGLTLDPLGGTNGVTVDGTAGNDAITVAQSGTNTTVRVNALLTATLVNADTQALAIAGGLGDDALTVDGASGVVFGGNPVAFDGGSGTNSVRVIGAAGAGNAFTLTPGASPSAGRVTAAGGTAAAVDFTGAGQVAVAGGGGASADVLNLGGAGTLSVNGTGPGAGTSAITGEPGVTFTNFGTASTINLTGTGGPDVFTVSQPVGWGIPTVNVSETPASATATLQLVATTNSDAISYDPLAGTVAIDDGSGATGVTNYTATGISAFAVDGHSPTAPALPGDTLVPLPISLSA
jgi:hypothetical protein